MSSYALFFLGALFSFWVLVAWWSRERSWRAAVGWDPAPGARVRSLPCWEQQLRVPGLRGTRCQELLQERCVCYLVQQPCGHLPGNLCRCGAEFSTFLVRLCGFFFSSKKMMSNPYEYGMYCQSKIKLV